MLLFIISEVMVFGAFFTAYFFIRIAQGEPWPAPGTHLPVDGRRRQHRDPDLLLVHAALGPDVDQEGQPLRAEGRASSPRSCSAARSSSSRSTSTRTSASPPRTTPSRRSSTRSPACTARTCSSASAAADRDGPRLPRALQPRGAPRRRDTRDLLALRRHHVDRGLHHGLRALTIRRHAPRRA